MERICRFRDYKQIFLRVVFLSTVFCLFAFSVQAQLKTHRHSQSFDGMDTVAGEIKFVEVKSDRTLRRKILHVIETLKSLHLMIKKDIHESFSLTAKPKGFMRFAVFRPNIEHFRI